MGDAELGLHRDRARRKRVVGRRCRQHDEIDRLSIDLGMGERGARRVRRHVRGPFAGRRDMALVDAGALHDPVVRGVDLARQIAVGEDLRRQIAAAAEDDRTLNRHEATPPTAWRAGLPGRPSAAVILAKSSSRTTPWPSSMAAAKPSASVLPWLLMTMPLRPRNTPPLDLRGSMISRNCRNAERAKK